MGEEQDARQNDARASRLASQVSFSLFSCLSMSFYFTLCPSVFFCLFACLFAHFLACCMYLALHQSFILSTHQTPIFPPTILSSFHPPFSHSNPPHSPTFFHSFTHHLFIHTPILTQTLMGGSEPPLGGVWSADVQSGETTVCFLRQ